jgi:hypothetical protein
MDISGPSAFYGLPCRALADLPVDDDDDDEFFDLACEQANICAKVHGRFILRHELFYSITIRKPYQKSPCHFVAGGCRVISLSRK